MTNAMRCTAFAGHRAMATGSLAEVAPAVADALARNPAIGVLVFNDVTGRVVDLDLRGDAETVRTRYTQADGPEEERRPDGEVQDATPARTRGRPKLGVVAREVTLLPRHWDWLAAQPGGASQALRRLVDEARRSDRGKQQTRAAQEAAYRFMSSMAGDLPGFEEASRALFAGDRGRFESTIAGWPADIRDYASRLAWASCEVTPA